MKLIQYSLAVALLATAVCASDLTDTIAKCNAIGNEADCNADAECEYDAMDSKCDASTEQYMRGHVIEAPLTKCKKYHIPAALGNQESPTKLCADGGAGAAEFAAGECYQIKTCERKEGSNGKACFRNHHDTMIMVGKRSQKYQTVDAGCGHETITCEATATLGVKADACKTCTTDLCNSGGVLKPSLVAALLAILSVLGFLA